MVHLFFSQKLVKYRTYEYISNKWNFRTGGEKSMKKPTLVIMAAGMGSRYGGLKQIDPIDPQGHIIMDYSIYDAVQAGFGKVVFII